MINYISLEGIDKLFNEWATNDPNIKGHYGFGQPFEVDGKPKMDQRYPQMFVIPGTTTLTNVTTREYQIMFYDIKTSDNSNFIHVISDCGEYAARFWRWLLHYSEDITVVQPPTYTYLNDRFLDDVAGVIMNITIQTSGDINYCNDPSNSASHYANQVD